jgi:hypothetical protein
MADSGKRNTKRVADDALRDERRAAVAFRLRQGWTERRIAADLGIGLTTVCRDVKAVREEWRSRASLDFDGHIAEELARLDVATGAVWPQVEAGDVAAGHLYVKLSKARRELLGLDAPARVEQKVKVENDDPLEALESSYRRAYDARSAREVSSGPDAGDKAVARS